MQTNKQAARCNDRMNNVYSTRKALIRCIATLAHLGRYRKAFGGEASITFLIKHVSRPSVKYAVISKDVLYASLHLLL
jgi:hypothetical protein